MKSGIYSIQCIITNKEYIGSTQDLKERKAQHLSYLRNNKHVNKKLQNAWNKYGEDSFVFEILEKCDIKNIEDIEQQYIDNRKPFFNIRKVCNSNRGLLHSNKTLKLLKKRTEDLWKTDEYKEKMKTKGLKPILCYDFKGNFIKEYYSVKEAAKELDIFSTNISGVLKGVTKIIKNYHFVYKTSDCFELKIEINLNKNSKYYKLL